MEYENQNLSPKKESNLFGWGMLVGSIVTMILVMGIGVVVLLVMFRGDVKQEEPIAQGTEGESFIDSDMVKKLATMEELIDTYYYDQVEDSTLEDGVYHGMMNAVGDPYTCYYSSEELKSMMEHTTGIYYGIGAYVSLDETGLYPMITAPIAGSPAEEADLRPGDIIYEVNGETTYGMDLDSVVALIKGKEGTTVDLTIVRSNMNDYLYVTVERRRVESPTVKSEMLEDGMAYIQITEFSQVTSQQFADALATAKGSDMKGLIIDLRANPGGSLTAVVDVARMLLPEGLIVYIEDKNGEREEYFSDGKQEFKLPLVVLVDGNSASASEVLAGAIKDYEMGTLVGTKTFGKGIVQQILTIDDGSAVKITTSSYYSPKGNNIHKKGIEPDMVCEFDAEAYYGEEKFDSQLDYAKKVLKEMME